MKIHYSLLPIAVLAMTSCALFDGGSTSKNTDFSIDNSEDLVPFTPEEGGGDADYYQSKHLILVTEIHGSYNQMHHFRLDPDNDRKRIYDNIYFYEDDFFYVMLYKGTAFTSLGQIYASLSDPSDAEYGELVHNNTTFQINIKKDGVYRLVLDADDYSVDMERVSDIETPVYEPITTCRLYVHGDAEKTYTDMTLDKATGKWHVQKTIPVNSSISFFSASGNSHYKMDVAEGLMNRYLYLDNVNPNSAHLHMGGNFDIYFDANSYVLDLTLNNPDTASYYCQVGWREGKELSPLAEAPYLFRHRITSTAQPGNYEKLPDFYPFLGLPFELEYVSEGGDYNYNKWIKVSGEFDLTVNLKEFTVTVTKAGE